MNKVFLSFLLIFMVNIVLPTQYNYNTANAGIITWGVKKVIGGAIKLIFSSASDRIVEYQKKKLFQYLRKHPEHIGYTKNLIKKQIDKHPKYKERGYKILNALSSEVNSVIYKKDETTK